MGKLLGVVIVVSALAAGVLLYYLQIYHFYDEVEDGSVSLTSLFSDMPEELLFEDLRAIDGSSSPIRYRACFTTPMNHALLTETYTLYPDAEPKVAPPWFDCFDADAIAAELESGSALAFLGQRDITYGIDRVVAISDSGMGYVWHQINPCGEVVFDGKRTPEGCPEPQE